jgi:hypothetical protein
MSTSLRPSSSITSRVKLPLQLGSVHRGGEDHVKMGSEIKPPMENQNN